MELRDDIVERAWNSGKSKDEPIETENLMNLLNKELNSLMMLLKIIMREEYMLIGIAIISSFLSMCLKL